MAKSKLLVTGASGFLGSHICEAAHNQGCEVHAHVRPGISQRWLAHNWLHIHVADFDDRKAIEAALADVDYLIHCAGVMATTSRNEKDSRRVNLDLTRMLAGQSINAGIKRFVFASSLAAGGPGRGPEARTEENPDNPVSHYGRSKKDAEDMLKSFAKDLPVVCLRFSTIYGPRDRNIFGFFKAVSGKTVPVVGGKKTLYNSMVYVEDAARAALSALAADVPSGSVYQISDGQPYPLPRLYAYFEQALDKKEKGKRVGVPFWLVMLQAWWLHDVVRKRGISPDQVRQMKARYWFASPAKAIRELGWKPEVGFKEGMARTVAWYRQQGWL